MASHKAMVNPMCTYSITLQEKGLMICLTLIKKKFQFSENPKINIERFKNWVMTADKSSEDYLGELNNFKTEGRLTMKIPCVEFIEHLMMDKIPETPRPVQEGKSKEEELFPKIIWRGRNSHDIEKFLPQIMVVLKKSATPHISQINIRILLRGIEGIGIPKMESEICNRFFTLSILTPTPSYL